MQKRFLRRNWQEIRNQLVKTRNSSRSKIPNAGCHRNAERQAIRLYRFTLHADPVLCKHLEEAGTAAVMPLGSPIGSNKD
jgi:hypothetical protein